MKAGYYAELRTEITRGKGEYARCQERLYDLEYCRVLSKYFFTGMPFHFKNAEADGIAGRTVKRQDRRSVQGRSIVRNRARDIHLVSTPHSEIK